MAAITAVPPAPIFHARGFTLTEMAVVLAIIALLIGGMIMPIATQREALNVSETQKSIAIISEAIYGFVAINGRLPRPATSATDGSERSATCASDVECTGFIPWATLGTPKTDSWGKLIRYSVTPDFANATVTLTTVANRTIQSRNPDGSLSYFAGQASCTTAGQCVPAVIFSHGKLGWGTTVDGTSLPDRPTTNADEDSNQNGPTNYFSRTVSTNTASTGGEFDDIVAWIPATVLINRMISAGRLP
jgi:prepilin-type N-terminal cleavage/methylation domain-containing protein